MSSLFLLPSSTAGSHQRTPKSHSEDDKATEWEEQESLNDFMEQSTPPQPRSKLGCTGTQGRNQHSEFKITERWEVFVTVLAYANSCILLLLFLKKLKTGPTSFFKTYYY